MSAKVVHFKVKLEMEGKASGGEQGAEAAGDTAAAAGLEAEATRQARLAKMVRKFLQLSVCPEPAVPRCRAVLVFHRKLSIPGPCFLQGAYSTEPEPAPEPEAS